LEGGRILRLRHELFDNDAIFLRNVASGVTLRCADGKRSVHMSYPNLPQLGFWHKPHSDAPYVCIEPWSSYPSPDGKVDDLETKQATHPLEPQGVYRNVYTITFG
jgi:galactose mutarotase-like enzyme